jgi:hypothetical protein
MGLDLLWKVLDVIGILPCQIRRALQLACVPTTFSSYQQRGSGFECMPLREHAQLLCGGARPHASSSVARRQNEARENKTQCIRAYSLPSDLIRSPCWHSASAFTDSTGV